MYQIPFIQSYIRDPMFSVPSLTNESYITLPLIMRQTPNINFEIAKFQVLILGFHMHGSFCPTLFEAGQTIHPADALGYHVSIEKWDRDIQSTRGVAQCVSHMAAEEYFYENFIHQFSTLVCEHLHQLKHRYMSYTKNIEKQYQVPVNSFSVDEEKRIVCFCELVQQAADKFAMGMIHFPEKRTNFPDNYNNIALIESIKPYLKINEMLNLKTRLEMNLPMKEVRAKHKI